MRRTPGASATRMYGRICAVPLSMGVLFAATMPNGAVSIAEPVGPEGVAALVAAVAEANQKLQELGAAVQTEQESVNKALVGVQDARDAAATAAQQVEASRRSVADANVAIADAQKRFDTYAVAAYVNGPAASYLSATDPSEALKTAAAGQAMAISSERVMDDLQRARTEQVNRESAARLAKENADKAAADAQASQDAAVTSLTEAQKVFGSQQAELDRLSAERSAAQAKLDAARPVSAPVAKQAATVPGAAPAPGANSANPAADWDRKPGAVPAGAQASQWDLTLPAIPSAFVSGDPIAIINAILGIMQTSAQLTADMGKKFLQKLGILPTPTGYTNNGAIPRVHGYQASEYVIKRAMSQIGVPYSWGGGNAAGKSRGIDSGAGTVGFDCSGLVLYAFAGVGIKLPHYSGSQYDMGRKIPTSQMRRGDVLFWGPGGSQHVAIYLGDNQMIEAPYTGSHVKISPVRTSGMTPHAVRYIEY
ncbi:NlpC/P60 family peptidoglycan endopeptidase RipA [Mycolicibacterium diernhoferi]|uniref:NlpC/P60 family protein n=3 Tax=Mycolicibacterium diernhoferi TaxID=1801 RepID=A0A1Q4HJ91_9MYCO|nr:NlpC/P60 family peptidoglycan endopeptidase RipA [Mycolicibacterium diernhoferi]OJZ67555.1 peptidase M23 [Mycolicibacterium diernhoferi]PEG55825.1 NlpC/P60 family protein [Mycolicibacterium diernhoferi]QYL25207.1 NlpC/P60 family peptidoglycan endopeptidase RipA [Mycolicibacterium diernhoferi]